MQTREQDNVQLNITVPRAYHDLLVRMAARKNLENPRSTSTKGGIAKDILCAHLEELMKEDEGGHCHG